SPAPHGPGALPCKWGTPCGGGPSRGIHGWSPGLRHPSRVGLVEAARSTAGPVAKAVGERGSPPTGLPVVVKRCREHRGTGVRARTESRSLETIGSNVTGSRQSARGHVTPRPKTGEK